ncbi:acyltransferase [Homoserinibacter sp. GY 40078]|uniref:acyltransferase family protein n=1 Tax=Homoserinibacter sp. GY 40078 TaxID=2603275 RepID=UPI0011C8F983|nr:acyltransferase [Homoserinibacter sp. GY 40078]TXK19314.1 acyltransferase [Homoserinibacter sp. GY 40078]
MARGGAEISERTGSNTSTGVTGSMVARGGHGNNFDAIRLFAALTVVVGHAWPLTGVPDPPSIAGVPVFTIAVWVFFAVSGSLITQSWVRSPSVLGFVRRRAGRIFPGLTAVVVLTTFVLGPAVTTVPIPQYFSSSETWLYLTNVSLISTYKLPGVFETNPRPVVNGVFWSLGPEFVCYLGVLVCGVLGSRFLWRHPMAVRMIIPIGFAVALGVVALTPSALLDPVRPIVTAMTFFAAGAAWSVLRTPPIWPALTAIPLAAVCVSLAPELLLPLAWLVLPYVVVALGECNTPLVRRAGRYGDFSYGIYLWGFPTQQVYYSLFPSAPLVAQIALTVATTGVVALLSWRLVERPALEWARGGRADRSANARRGGYA